MSSTIAVNRVETLTVVETISTADAADATLSFTSLNESDSFTSGSSVPVTKHANFSQAMTAGAATINFRLLPGNTVDEVVDGNGLKVQFAWFRNKSTNANDITITFGGSNPYLLLGAAFLFKLKVGQAVRIALNEAAPDIDDTHKTIDITGTLSQVLECAFVMG